MTNTSDATTTATMTRQCMCQFIPSEDDDDDAATTTVVKPTRCSVCVGKALKPYLDAHQRAIEAHKKAKQQCSLTLNTIPDPSLFLGSLQAQSSDLRQLLATLKQQSSEMAVRVAAKAVENDQHQEVLQKYTTIPRNNSIITDETTTTTTIPRQQQEDLSRLEQTLLETSMGQAINDATSKVKNLRFLYARTVFKMHRIQIDENDLKMDGNKRNSTHRVAKGIAKIGGLPLPNAGPELYGVLPVGELVSALRLVASLTSTLARCLSISLPHPILLQHHSNNTGDITETVSPQELQEYRQQMQVKMGNGSGNVQQSRQNANNSNNNNNPMMLHHHHYQPHQGGVPSPYGHTTTTTTAPTSSSSSSYLSSMMDGPYWTKKAKSALKKATAKATGNYGHGGLQQQTNSGGMQSQQSAYPTSSAAYGYGNQQQSGGGMYNNTSAPSSSTFIPPSTDATIVAQRLKHATACVIADDGSEAASTFVLSPIHESDFPIALQLLQNNILTLSIKTGVSISQLWPAQAMLLNLYELQRYCQSQTGVVVVDE